jgi:hypothetical protein
MEQVRRSYSSASSPSTPRHSNVAVVVPASPGSMVTRRIELRNGFAACRGRPSARFIHCTQCRRCRISDQRHGRADGTRLNQFGANPKGINVFDSNGRFLLMVASADNSKIVSNDPSKTNSEEDGLVVESIAYYGTYTVDEAVNVISLHLDASTFPNQVGTDQKRIITSLTADELKYSSPAAISGVQVHQVWKRAK